MDVTRLKRRRYSLYALVFFYLEQGTRMISFCGAYKDIAIDLVSASRGWFFKNNVSCLYSLRWMG